MLRLLAGLLITLVVLVGLAVSLPQNSSTSRPTDRSAKHPHQGSSEYSGSVVNETGQPLPQAMVRFKGASESVQTDARGRFRIQRQEFDSAVLCATTNGYFIGSIKAEAKVGIQIQLRRLPTNDHETYGWVSPHPDARFPQRCGNCHQEIYRQWSSSAHADSARNRHFLDLYAPLANSGSPNDWSLERDHKSGMGVCASCHLPSAEPISPSQADIRKASGTDAAGVHCDFCHKIQASNLTETSLGITHGRYAYNLLRPREGQIFFGPLPDVDRDEDVFAPQYKRSRYCAGCHEGTVLGTHVYGTYREWLSSPAARRGVQCQDCHMKSDGQMTNIAPESGGIERRTSTLSSHRFAQKSIPAMLREAVKLDVGSSATDSERSVSVSLRLEGVGHHVPTGFVDRHLLLKVLAFDAQGKPIKTTSGTLLPTWATYPLPAAAGKLFAHVLEDEHGNRPAPFWRVIVKSTDSRLRPDQPYQGKFSFPPQARTARVQLIYRRFWPQVALTKGWPRKEWEYQVGDKSIEW